MWITKAGQLFHGKENGSSFPESNRKRDLSFFHGEGVRYAFTLRGQMSGNSHRKIDDDPYAVITETGMV
jgi:hypothetical protein